MGVDQLSESATISDIIDKLANPEEYVRGVLENLYDCKREHGMAVVRLGISGQGLVPNYSVWFGNRAGALIVHDVFNGRNHKELDLTPLTSAALFDDDRGRMLTVENWSTKTMTLDEVAALLGKLRGFKPKRK